MPLSGIQSLGSQGIYEGSFFRVFRRREACRRGGDSFNGTLHSP